MIGIIILQVVLIALNAVFACAEIAVLSISDTKLEKMAEEGNKKAKRLFRLTRDQKIVDAYVADPLCGFVPSAGLVRDMMTGFQYIQDGKNLDAMKKDLPVFFVAGGDDPVGGYGTGVEQCAAEFRKHGMEHVELKIYPLCRHEIHNEINRHEVYEDLAGWVEKVI